MADLEFGGLSHGGLIVRPLVNEPAPAPAPGQEQPRPIGLDDLGAVGGIPTPPPIDLVGGDNADRSVAGLPEPVSERFSELAAQFRPADRAVAAQLAEVESSLNEMFAQIRAQYAPTEFKAAFGASPGNPRYPAFDSVDDWLAFVQNQALEEIEAAGALSAEELVAAGRLAMREVWAGLRDYHVDGTFQASEIARLGFRLRGEPDADGNYRYAVGFVPDDHPLADELRGMEIVSVDGMTMEQAIAPLRAGGDPDLINKFDLDQNFAELFFTVRVAALGEPMPSGDAVVLSLRDPATGETRDVTVPWEVTGAATESGPAAFGVAEDMPMAMIRQTAEELAARVGTFAPMEGAQPRTAGLEAGPAQMSVREMAGRVRLGSNYAGVQMGAGGLAQMLAARPEFLMHDRDADVIPVEPGVNPYRLGGRTSYIPTLGDPIDASDENDLFHWYTFEAPNGELHGYFRLPTYSPSLPPNPDGTPDDRDPFEVHIDQMRKVFALFNEIGVEELHFDQVQNPGGAVPYSAAVTSFLLTQPLAAERHAVIMTDERKQANEELLTLIDALSDDAREQIIALDPNISDEDLADAIAVALLGPSFAGYTVSGQFLEDFVEGIQLENAAHERGEGNLTAPVTINGIDIIEPDPDAFGGRINYYIDEASISAGDSGAARARRASFEEVQEDGDISERRIRIVSMSADGSSGAGGFVRTFDPVELGMANRLGIDTFRLTGSIAIQTADPRDLRAEEFIEGVGVQGDVVIAPTFEDVIGGHVGLGERILEFSQDSNALRAADEAAAEAARQRLDSSIRAVYAGIGELGDRAEAISAAQAALLSELEGTELEERVQALVDRTARVTELVTDVRFDLETIEDELAEDAPPVNLLAGRLDDALADVGEINLDFNELEEERFLIEHERFLIALEALRTQYDRLPAGIESMGQLVSEARSLYGSGYSTVGLYYDVREKLGASFGDRFLEDFAALGLGPYETASFYQLADSRANTMAEQVQDPARYGAIAAQLNLMPDTRGLLRLRRAIDMAKLTPEQMTTLAEHPAFLGMSPSALDAFRRVVQR